MTNISIVSKTTWKSVDILNPSFSLNKPSVVILKCNKEEIKDIARNGDNLVITLENGEVIQIENFFAMDNSLVLEDNDKLLWVQFSDLNHVALETVNYAGIEHVEPLLYDDGAGVWPFVAGVAGAIATGTWIANTSLDNDKNHNDRDTTAPDAPSDVVISADGKTVTGKAEAGSTVEIKDKNGNLLGSGKA
ncbi:BapA/Bap/LapF family prefix-like domain-containing protein, partial [Acinetobacter sichuanensis]